MNAKIQPIPMSHRAPMQGYPKGWYGVADSTEVVADKLLPVSWLEKELIVFRTADGKAQVADAYCPHLGAHLASHDGCIKEGKIVCPFHKWGFDAETGKCIDIPYAKAIPPVSLELYETLEMNGQVVMWYHPEGKDPDHQPYRSVELDEKDWVLFDSRNWTTRCPFRDLLENLFDSAHILMLHNAHETPQLESVTDKPYGLRYNYKINPDLADHGTKSITGHISGISLQTQHYEFVNTEALFISSFTPINQEEFVMKSHLYLLDNVPDDVMKNIGEAFVERYIFEVDQDLAVLDYKKHLTKPRLCDSDGPIMRFRQHAEQYFVS